MAPNSTSTPLKHSERGSTLTLFALSLVTIFFMLGVSIDLGTAYVEHARMTKAIDAGVLTGARYAGRGDAEMERMAIKIATANNRGSTATNYQVKISTPSTDATRISMTGSKATKSRFSVFMGVTSLNVSSTGEATRYPLDMNLSLDLSASLARNNAFVPMQDAAEAFLDFFDDGVDQVGVSVYSTWGMEVTPVTKFFKIPAGNAIRALTPISDTNIQEGLRVAGLGMLNAPVRSAAQKIVVLFTDGRPTAYRDRFNFKGKVCPQHEAIVATYISGSLYRGLFRHSDGLKIVDLVAVQPGKAAVRWNALGVGNNGNGPNNDPFSDVNGNVPVMCDTTVVGNLVSNPPSPKPINLHAFGPVNGNNIRAAAGIKSEDMASALRNAGYTIYVVGLGNPRATNPLDTPDLPFLRRIANQGGRVNASQPQGEMFFAPTPADLDKAFQRVAERVLTRITR